MTILFGFGLLVFACVVSILLVEYRNKRRLELLRNRNPLGIAISQVFLCFSALNSIWISLVDALGMMGSTIHIFFILLSIPVSIEIGHDMFRQKQEPSDPVDRELWWIDGFLLTSSNPVETLETHVNTIQAKKKLTATQLATLLQRLSTRNDAVGSKAKEMLEVPETEQN